MVVQSKEASKEEKIGGNKEVPQRNYRNKQPAVRTELTGHQQGWGWQGSHSFRRQKNALIVPQISHYLQSMVIIIS